MKNSNDDLYSNLMSIFRWVPILVYLNILWIIGSLLGLIFLGVGPATISLFDTLKELSWKNSFINIRKYFFAIYKQEWKKVNKWMFFLYGILIFFWIDYRIITFFNANKFLIMFVFPLFLILLIIVILTIIFFFCFYSNFDEPTFKIIENSLLLSLSNPGSSFLVLLVLIVHYNLVLRWPMLFIFFLVSLPAFLIVLILKKLYFKIIFLSKNDLEN